MINRVIDLILKSEYSTKIEFLRTIYGEDGINILGEYYNLYTEIDRIVASTDFTLLDDRESLKNLLNKIKNKDLDEYFESYNRDRILDEVYSSNIYDEVKKRQISTIKSAEKRFYELLDYQYIIKNRVLSMLEVDPYSKLIIHMPTGSGKTKTAMHILCSFLSDNLSKRPIILWLAHSKELIEQAADTMISSWKSLGVGEIDIMLSSSSDFNVQEDFVGTIFCTYQKLVSLNKRNENIYQILKKNTRMIITDEAHHSTASEWKVAIEGVLRNEKSALIGLTATPGRADGKDLTDFYDNNLISIDMETAYRINYSKYQFDNLFKDIISFDPVKELQNRKILAKLNRSIIEFNEYTKEQTELFQQLKEDETIIELSKIASRNKAIINKIMELHDKKLSTIVFSCTNQHAYLLQKILAIKGVITRVITSDTSSIVREKYIQDFKSGKCKILINNRVLTTGFDAPNTECIFITRPTSSIITYSQMIGRGLRGPKVGGNETCLLIDIVDNLKNYSDENNVFRHFEQYWR